MGNTTQFIDASTKNAPSPENIKTILTHRRLTMFQLMQYVTQISIMLWSGTELTIRRTTREVCGANKQLIAKVMLKVAWHSMVLHLVAPPPGPLGPHSRPQVLIDLGRGGGAKKKGTSGCYTIVGRPGQIGIHFGPLLDTQRPH